MERAIILASGPSLCEDDAAAAMASGWPVIAVNSSWQLVPDCDVIYAGDLEWWLKYQRDIPAAAARWTCHPLAASQFNLNLHKATGSYNSGQRAIQFAASQGARRIILLGFDCSLDGGTHWHGEHSGLRNPNDQSIQRWQPHFVALAQQLGNIDIINCSRRTSLTCFPRETLCTALAAAPLLLRQGQRPPDLSRSMA